MHSRTLTSLYRTTFTLAIAFTVSIGALVQPARAAGETFAASDASGWVDRAITIDLQINGTGDDPLEFNLFVPDGSFSFGSTSSVTFTGPATGPSIKMSGTRTALNAVLATLTYTSGDAETVLAEAWLGIGGGDFVYNSETQHVYQVVTATSTWDQAKDLAENSDFDGIPGYLATITSQQEHDFILPRIDQDGWIGGTDSGVEGEWRWQTGPETGIQFWQGTSTGNTVSSSFAYWNTNEPNNDTGTGPEGEDCTEIRFSASSGGRWNDLPCTADRANFVVEYGAPGNLPVVVATDFEIEVTEVPDNVVALEKIQEYADSNGASAAPTVQDYDDAGIAGVTTGNLAAVNAEIAQTDPADLDDVSDIQTLVTPVVAYHLIAEYASSGGTTTEPTVQNYTDAGLTGVTADNIAEVNAAVAEGGTITDLSELQGLVDAGIEDAEPSSSRSGSRRRTVDPTTSAQGSSMSALQAQLAQLQAQLAALTGQTPSPSVVRDLTVGSVGDDVRSLQTLLIAQGFAISAGATGYFGSQTQTALSAYQAAKSITPAAGYFGAITRAQMKSGGLAGLWW